MNKNKILYKMTQNTFLKGILIERNVHNEDSPSRWATA